MTSPEQALLSQGTGAVGCSAVWLAQNRSATLRNLLELARLWADQPFALSHRLKKIVCRPLCPD